MNWPWKPIVIEKPDIPPDVVLRSLSAEVDKLPIFESVLCVLDEQKKAWNENAPLHVSDHGLLAAHVYAIFALDQLREKLIELRLQGRKDD